MSIAPSPNAVSVPGFDVRLHTPSSLLNGIHLWWLPSTTTGSAAASVQEGWWSLLSSDELARAARFHFSQHAEEWVSYRARLRVLLGQYLQQDGHDIKFHYDESGKPHVVNSGDRLAFNLTHTEGMAIVAVTSGRRVGVDLERSGGASDAMELARHAFSHEEVSVLKELRLPDQQQDAFLKIWTCKEAFLKGLGEGLSRPLNQFCIRLDHSEPQIADCAWDGGIRDGWQLYSLDAPAGFVASLAVESTTRLPIQSFTWNMGPSRS